MDTRRWFNELTHKYLEFVRVYHLTCSTLAIKHELDALYQSIRIDGRYENIEQFASMLHQAQEELKAML